MKPLLVSLVILMILNPTLSTEESNENPTLVFFVKHVDEPENDFVELSLKIESKDQSLTTAIKKGASSVEEISSYAKDFCEDHAKKKGDCKEIVDADAFEIEPRYQLIRKEPVFMGFTVTNEMTIAIKSVENIGYLVDKILEKEGTILNDFKWKSSKENNANEEALAEGMEEGEGLCEQLGLKLGRIISVAEVHASEAEAAEENEKEEEEDEKEDEDEENLTVFKFEVECEEKISTKKE